MLFTNCCLNAAEKKQTFAACVGCGITRERNETRAAWEAFCLFWMMTFQCISNDFVNEKKKKMKIKFIKANRFGNDPWTRGEAIFIQKCLSSSCIQVAFSLKILWNSKYSEGKKNLNKSINNNCKKRKRNRKDHLKGWDLSVDF